MSFFLIFVLFLFFFFLSFFLSFSLSFSLSLSRFLFLFLLILFLLLIFLIPLLRLLRFVFWLYFGFYLQRSGSIRTRGNDDRRPSPSSASPSRHRSKRCLPHSVKDQGHKIRKNSCGPSASKSSHGRDGVATRLSGCRLGAKTKDCTPAESRVNRKWSTQL